MAVSSNESKSYSDMRKTLADLQHRGLKKIGFVNNELL